MALALTPNLIWMIWTTVFESCCTEYGNKWQHVPASWLFCSISPHLGWDCVWDGLCGRTTAKILGQSQQETAGKMTEGLSHFQKKHESTFLDNKKIEIGYPNRVADLSNILHTQLLLHRMVYPLLWLCFDVYVQNTDILYVSWLISKFTSTFSFGSDWGAGTSTGQLAVKKVAYYSQERRGKRDFSQNFQKQEKKALKLQNKTFCTRMCEREKKK